MQEVDDLPNLIILVDRIVNHALACPVNIKPGMADKVVVKKANKIPRMIQRIRGEMGDLKGCQYDGQYCEHELYPTGGGNVRAWLRRAGSALAAYLLR